MKISEAFPSKYVTAPDLNGQDRTLIIENVTSESVGKPPQVRPVVYFNGAQKGLVLNQTNGNTIALHHGDEMNNWGGKQITIYPTTTEFGSKVVDCIRVRTPGQVAIPNYGAQERAHQTLVRPPQTISDAAGSVNISDSPATLADELSDDIPF